MATSLVLEVFLMPLHLPCLPCLLALYILRHQVESTHCRTLQGMGCHLIKAGHLTHPCHSLHHPFLQFTVGSCHHSLKLVPQTFSGQGSSGFLQLKTNRWEAGWDDRIYIYMYCKPMKNKCLPLWYPVRKTRYSTKSFFCHLAIFKGPKSATPLFLFTWLSLAIILLYVFEGCLKLLIKDN